MPGAHTMTLTEEQKQNFLANGWAHLTGCFTKETADEVTKNVWTRLGMSPSDQSTWSKVRTNMPSIRAFDSSVLAPKAWSAIAELCGGEDRVHPASKEWRDSLIVNLGSKSKEGKDVKPWEMDEWHVDGDFFVHYLDSPEQALLVVPLWTDVVEGGGGTWICPPGMKAVAEHLYSNPDGVSPRMAPRSTPQFSSGVPFCEGGSKLGWFNQLARRIGAEQGMDGFVEVTGKLGDVYLLHPLMLHASSHNPKRKVRIITNPPVSLRKPFELDRKDKEQYSLVEQGTLKALGVDGGLSGWKTTAAREKVIPERVRIQEEMKKDEMNRMEEARRAVATA
ncbi:hypothetical protein MKZ38_006120 [Zalerion maritima]|uniref:Uncharacterized protein n=1 Tax=Zalerion maritima TaxID=339359 RepID=A0AAD5WU26_9PEZI|nr:hypothetical protein MKZ38_006120 [Zalerion maritima]